MSSSPCHLAGGGRSALARITKLLSFDRNFAGLGREQMSTHADEIRQVEVREDVPLLVAQNIFLRIDLDAAALVAHVNEHALAHVAVRGDAAGHGYFAALGVILTRIGAGFGWRKFVLERVNALGAQRGEFGLALFDQ